MFIIQANWIHQEARTELTCPLETKNVVRERRHERKMAENVVLYAHCMISFTTSPENAQIPIMQSESNRSRGDGDADGLFQTLRYTLHTHTTLNIIYPVSLSVFLYGNIGGGIN